MTAYAGLIDEKLVYAFIQTNLSVAIFLRIEIKTPPVREQLI